ncbi:MAG: sulfite exporter TauE/SafE family protein [Burkholderiaceae bacterium]|nr:sulfite exporter TauE/SafE family protein [Burkholderiaceae bacterium]
MQLLVVFYAAFLLLFSGLKKILQKEFEEVARVRLIENIILFLVGFWLGLIVLDGATYLLLALIVFVRLPLVKANAYKNLVLFVTSAIALSVFARNGEVNWEIGGVMAVGAVLGGLIGARFALNPIAKVWTFRFLVIIISLELVHIGMQYIY